MMHRIRFGMAEDLGERQPKLSGTVESDEPCVGGKPRNKQSRPGPRIGMRQENAGCVSLVERGGNIGSFVTADVTADNVWADSSGNISRDSHLMTDSAAIYMRGKVTKPFARHGFTDHSRGQYAKPDGTHSNTVESLFSLLKRGIYGTIKSSVSKRLRCREPVATLPPTPIQGTPF